MKTRLTFLVLAFIFAFLGTSFAAINIENRTGAIKLFLPDNKQVVIQKDDPLPVIPDGTVITILAGTATVSTTGKSTVAVSIGNYNLILKEKSKINLTLNADGTVSSTIVLGSAEINRRPEPYKEPLPPGATELLGNDNKWEISPSQ